MAKTHNKMTKNETKIKKKTEYITIKPDLDFFFINVEHSCAD